MLGRWNTKWGSSLIPKAERRVPLRRPPAPGLWYDLFARRAPLPAGPFEPGLPCHIQSARHRLGGPPPVKCVPAERRAPLRLPPRPGFGRCAPNELLSPSVADSLTVHRVLLSPSAGDAFHGGFAPSVLLSPSVTTDSHV